MALAFSNLTPDEIISLSKMSNPEITLNKMSFDELEILNEQISEIFSDIDYNTSLYERLMRLRTYIVLSMWSE